MKVQELPPSIELGWRSDRQNAKRVEEARRRAGVMACMGWKGKSKIMVLG